MSYINEALKKAQELKDSGQGKYYNIPESINRGNRRLKIKVFLYSLSIIIAVSLVFSGYLWLDSLRDKKEGVTVTLDKGSTDDTEITSEKKKLYDKAMVLYRAGSIMEAKKLYEEAVGLDPGYVEALNNLGIIYIHDKDFNAAKEKLEKAARLNPAYVESYYNLACLYAIKGDIDQGVEYFKKAFSLDKSVREWAINDSDLLNLRRSDEFNKMLSE